MNQSGSAKGKRRVPHSRGVSIKLDSSRGSPDPVDDAQVREWIQSQPRPWAIDLFAGAGGLSLGLSQAGFSVIAAADNDSRSLETHSHNIGGLIWNGDLADPDAFKSQLSRWGIDSVDLVAGGPPCQPFSQAGTPKIADLVRNSVRSPIDRRAHLWTSFLDIIDYLDARAVLIENVPGFATTQSGHTLTTLLSKLEDRGYWTDVKELKSWLYGVPQLRKRLFVIGLREERGFEWPLGSDSTTSVYEAIGDLPVADGGQREEILPYEDRDEPSDFVLRMRSSLHGSERGVIRDHITRFVRDDDAAIFAIMKPGQTYRDIPEHLRRYRSDAFTDKYNRLTWNGLSRTITAHISKDGYWYIHPEQNRTLSIREAARLQTFPDSFRFAGPPSSRYKQIGNAVPPLLARQVGAALKASLGGRVIRESDSGYRDVSIRNRLISWFIGHQRSYRWRTESDPWHILLAEVCLRRTRAGQVADNFSSLLSLASSPDDLLKNKDEVRLVMAHLGINNRVDDLVKLAAKLIDDHNGAVPPSYGDLIQLPGVGDYIASATLCFAYGQPTTLVDANTTRFVQRFSGKKKIAPWEQRLTLHRLAKPGVADANWNYALLDLGALVCKPRNPGCHGCPLRTNCYTGSTSGASMG